MLFGVAGLASYIYAGEAFAGGYGVGHGDWIKLDAGVGMTSEATVFMYRINFLWDDGVAYGAGGARLTMIMVCCCLMTNSVTGLTVRTIGLACRKAD